MTNNENTDTGKGTTLTEEGEGWRKGEGRDSRVWGGWGGITPGEMPDVGNEGMETANHHGMYVPMQQSCRM